MMIGSYKVTRRKMMRKEKRRKKKMRKTIPKIQSSLCLVLQQRTILKDQALQHC